MLVQTFTPDHPAIALAGTHDYEAFVAAEMVHRRQHNYPPFQRLVRIIVRSNEQQEAADFAETMGRAFHDALEQQRVDGRRRRCGCSGPLRRRCFG